MEKVTVMGKITIQDLTEHNINSEGTARARFIHTEHCTIAFWSLDKGAIIPRHQHVQEACPIIIKGTLKLIVDNIPYVLTDGQCAIVQSNIGHEAIALEACEILEIIPPFGKTTRSSTSTKWPGM